MLLRAGLNRVVFQVWFSELQEAAFFPEGQDGCQACWTFVFCRRLQEQKISLKALSLMSVFVPDELVPTAFAGSVSLRLLWWIRLAGLLSHLFFFVIRGRSGFWIFKRNNHFLANHLLIGLIRRRLFTRRLGRRLARSRALIAVCGGGFDRR